MQEYIYLNKDESIAVLDDGGDLTFVQKDRFDGVVHRVYVSASELPSLLQFLAGAEVAASIPSCEGEIRIWRDDSDLVMAQRDAIEGVIVKIYISASVVDEITVNLKKHQP
jgi:hypothetical protein